MQPNPFWQKQGYIFVQIWRNGRGKGRINSKEAMKPSYPSSGLKNQVFLFLILLPFNYLPESSL